MAVLGALQPLDWPDLQNTLLENYPVTPFLTQLRHHSLSFGDLRRENQWNSTTRTPEELQMAEKMGVHQMETLQLPVPPQKGTKQALAASSRPSRHCEFSDICPYPQVGWLTQ